MKRGLLAIVLVGALVLPAPPAATQTPEERAARLSQRIMSPFCDGVTLHDCPSAESDDMRSDIAQMASEGMSDAEILDRLEAEYGPGIRATPDNGAAWVTPALFALTGMGLIVWLARRWTPSGDEPSGERRTAPMSEGDRARVRAELDAYRDEP
jgi:cytochrome c-type biogenesis protein CcmH/NrfF